MKCAGVLTGRRRVHVAACAIAGALAGGPWASADTWTNAIGNGQWFLSQNWADGTVPTGADTVIFPVPGPASQLITLVGGASADALQFDNNFQLDGGAISLTSDTVTVASGKTAIINSQLSAGPDFHKNGAGTLVLGATSGNSVSGYFNINAGAVRISAENQLGNPQTVRLTGNLEAGGTFTLNKPMQTLGGGISVMAGQTMTLGSSAYMMESGPSPYPAFNKDGPGTLVVNSYSSRNGVTNVNAGTLRLESSAQLGYAMMTVNPGATLELVNRYYTLPLTLVSGSTLRGIGNSTVGVTLSSGSVTYGGGPPPVPVDATLATSAASDIFNVTFSGTATNSSMFTITGPGTVVPAAFSYVGSFRVNGGKLRAPASMGTGSTPVEVNSGGTLEFAGSFTARPVQLNNGASLRSTGSNSNLPNTVIAANANVTISPTSTGESLFTSPQLSGGAGATINIVGPGITTANQPITYAGGWSVNSGVLRVQNNPSVLGTGTSAIGVNGGILEMQIPGFSRDIALNSGTLRLTSLHPGRVIVGNGANVALHGGSVVLGDGANDLTGGGANTYIHILGSSPGVAITLAQPSDVMANWLIDGGTLAAPADANLGHTTNTVTVNTFGTLRLTGSVPFARDLNAQGGSVDTIGFDPSVAKIAGTKLTKLGVGTLTATHVRVGDLAVAVGTIKIAPGGGPVQGISKVDTLTANTGRVDLTDNGLIVTTTPLGSHDGSQYTGVLGMAQRGYNGGAWDGTTGIMTSDATALTGLTTLAVVPASAAALANPNEFRGVSISAGDTLVGYTWGGDANLDGEINGDDYFAIDSNVINSGSVFGFHKGDFNYDGAINGDDYFIIDSNITFAQNSPPFPTGSNGGGMATVPEPGALGMLIGSAALWRRRKRP